MFTPGTWLKWMDAYGPSGEPAPRVTDSLLLGGTHNGERMAIPHNEWIVRLPVRETPKFTWTAEPAPAMATFRVEEYERRVISYCWDAAPVGRWVLHGMDDEHAMAMMEEFRV